MKSKTLSQLHLEPSRRPPPVSLRSVLIGVVGAVAVVCLQVVSKSAPRGTALPLSSVTTLLPGPVICLFLMALANLLLARWRPSSVFRPAEFAMVFGIVTVAASIGAQDELQYLIPMVLYPFRKAAETDAGEFRRFIPSWYVPRSPDVVEPYYLGKRSFWEPALWQAWVVPLLVWTGWTLALGATMWAWNVILRRRWMDSDRLEFPAIRLPMEMCRSAGFSGMLSGRIFWSGLAFASLWISLAQLNVIIPAIPTVPTGYVATAALDGAPAPWNALSPMYLAWDPFHIGICYFIPLDICFSGWFFYVFRKGMEVFGYAFGWRDLGWDAKGFPFTRAQASGSWIVLFFLLVWAERHHLKQVFRVGFGLEAAIEDSREPGSYRWAARILVSGGLFLVAFSVYAGMSPLLALAYYGFYWMLTVTMTRIYAQVGPPIEELYFIDPQRFITSLFGARWDTARSWTLFSLLYWINRDHRGQPMAHQLAAFKVGNAAEVPPRAMGKLVLLGFAVGTAACLLAYLHWAYRIGEDQWAEGGWRESAAPFAIARIRDWVYNRPGPAWIEIAFMGVGGFITWALAKLQYTLIGFPFHPIGFALAMCFAVEYNWPAFFIAWLVKLLLLRYGGRGLFLQLAPFFLGMVLGGTILPPIWGAVAWIFRWYR
ncbi:MAG: hypothetical protein IT210_14960 [Armatimonadetes bacterium]|nr:hypothetical protein [Armatimonadota bacterium]